MLYPHCILRRASGAFWLLFLAVARVAVVVVVRYFPP